MKIKYTELFIFIVSAELVGALSALITGDFAGFFDRYASPLLMPPAWLFPVVWAVLYSLMGVSAYLTAALIKSGHCGSMPLSWR